MIPAAFDYIKAGSADEAVALLAEHGEDAKLLAGGHSLIPLLKFRLATPSVLVDIGDLSDLSYIREEGDQIAIGALTRHVELERSPVLANHVPLLAYATSKVGDPQVRYRGTIGGALAHSDPAADHPAVLLALRGTMVAQGPHGRREIPADEFFAGFLQSALAPDEMVVEVRVPKVGNLGWSFQKFNRRAQDWAIVGVAAVVGNGHTGIGLVNMDQVPCRAIGTEAALAEGASDNDAAARASEGCAPPEDLNADAAYRRHLATVLVRRALGEARQSASSRVRKIGVSAGSACSRLLVSAR